jgi:hypothetical protein
MVQIFDDFELKSGFFGSKTAKNGLKLAGCVY